MPPCAIHLGKPVKDQLLSIHQGTQEYVAYQSSEHEMLACLVI